MADDLITYEPGTPFPGTIGRTLETSTPAWPARPQPPEGAPNVMVIVLDDVGYGQLSVFGGPCDTPNLDRLAARGLRYSNFQTTALCSPTRAALLARGGPAGMKPIRRRDRQQADVPPALTQKSRRLDRFGRGGSGVVGGEIVAGHARPS